MKKIMTLSRNLAENKFIDGSSIISLYSLDLDPGPINTNLPCLSLQVADVIPETFEEYRTMHEGEYDTSNDLFSDDHCKAIKEFIDIIPEDHILIVNCHFGKSRSVAVAKAISMIYRIPYKIEDKVWPNEYILEKLCRYLEG